MLTHTTKMRYTRTNQLVSLNTKSQFANFLTKIKFIFIRCQGFFLAVKVGWNSLLWEELNLIWLFLYKENTSRL